MRVTEKEMVLVVHPVVDADRFRVLLGIVEAQTEAGRGDQRVIPLCGERRHAVEVLGKRALAAERQLVAGERLARPGSRVSSQGIVDSEAPALSIDQASEIALPEGGWRNGDVARGGGAQLVSFVG